MNQDRVLLHFDENAKVVVFGVFDGHGDDGHIVSNVDFGMVCDSSLFELRFYTFFSQVSYTQSFL